MITLLCLLILLIVLIVAVLCMVGVALPIIIGIGFIALDIVVAIMVIKWLFFDGSKKR